MEQGEIEPAGRNYAPALVLGVSILSVTLAAEFLVDSGIVSSTFMPAPSAVSLALPEALSKSARVMGETLGEIGAAFGLSLVFGVALGLIMGNVKYAQSTLGGYVAAIYSTPKIVILPLFLVWFGLGTNTVVLFATLEAAFPIAMLVSSAVGDLDKNMLLVGRSMGASQSQLQTKVVLPALAPTVRSAVRLGLVFSTTGAILAQMYLGFGGVGSLLSDDAYQLRIPELYALAFTFALIVLTVLWMTDLILSRYLPVMKR